MVNHLFESFIVLDDLINYLKKSVRLKEIYQKVLHQKIIDQTAHAKGIIVTQDEIQAESDRLRRESRLEKASDTLAWLNDQMITAEDLEAGIRDRLLTKKLSHILFDQEVKAAFAQHRSDFDQVVLYQIIVSEQTIAQELFFQIEERETSFFEAAHLYNQDESLRQTCGYAGKLYRWNLKPEVSAAVFNARSGDLLEPLKTDQGYHLLWVKAFIPAQLTPEIYQEILDGLFGTWLFNECRHLLD
ncbi:peptidyl-prolyl cis-trans isomerase [Phormidesmis sp. 146-35]